jgi:hypothetical protein
MTMLNFVIGCRLLLVVFKIAFRQIVIGPAKMLVRGQAIRASQRQHIRIKFEYRIAYITLPCSKLLHICIALSVYMHPSPMIDGVMGEQLSKIDLQYVEMVL